MILPDPRHVDEFKHALEIFLTKLEQQMSGFRAATGTATRTTFDTATVTLPQLAERVKAMIDDLMPSPNA